MITIPSAEDYKHLLDRIVELERQIKLMQNGAASDWMTLNEVKQLFQVHTTTIQNWRIRGILPGRKVGSRWYYKKADVNKLFEPEEERKRRHY